MPQPTRALLLLLLTWIISQPVTAEGLNGDPAAIADARAMVESMGGLTIWSRIESLHFVHEWDFVNREDRYLENEILDLTGPRSWVSMKCEIVALSLNQWDEAHKRP